ncbi:hypothetical protein [Pseudofulvibacter geojedonensis]|uniref:Uncharacterized protein n=1 Tax=Pseudofulvibacter geojedonensis TaxID=1123758 RepID=A0ABW3I3M7_9FLAO
MKKILIILLCISSYVYSQQGVGIGTTSPQQKLHLSSSTGSMRVESLNGVNNTFNGGDVNGDTNLTNDTFPLYVNANGEFTLEFVPLYNSEHSDALDHSVLPTSEVTLDANDVDGIQVEKLFTYTVSVNRQSILEVKYNLSFKTYLDSAMNPITDYLARRITTYFQVDGVSTRKYGPAAKCYTNQSTAGVVGPLYNVCTAYINLPAAGTYNVSFYGEVSGGVKAGGPGTNSKSTHVKFAVGNDSLLFRLH